MPLSGANACLVRREINSRSCSASAALLMGVGWGKVVVHLSHGIKSLTLKTESSDPMPLNDLEGAVRRMRTRIRFLAQPEPMRSIVGAIH